MSSRRILTCCLGLSIVMFLGCGDNVIEPGTTARTPETALASQPARGDEVTSLGESDSYFPLHEGDRWVYAVTEPWDAVAGEQFVEVNVMGSQMIDGYLVYDLDNYLFPISDSQTQFFTEVPGEAMELSGKEIGCWYPWSQFGENEVPIALPDFAEDCIHGSGGMCLGLGTVRVPAGTFHRVATILYDDIPCLDLGLAEEVLAPGVGLIERTTYTILGAQTWSLVYAKVGDREWGEPPQP